MSERITINDFVDAGVCARGVRKWANERDLDFRDFLKNGVAVKDVEQFLPNGYLEAAIAKMRERTN